MTDAPIVDAEVDQPVSKRTRRAGVVTSIGDPNLTDRSKVAPLFLSKKEKLEKLYKREQDKLAESTKTRLNDWKSVIGVEKDASKVCPVFQKASLASSASASLFSKPVGRSSIAELPAIDPLPAGAILPDPYSAPFKPETEIAELPPDRIVQLPTFGESEASGVLHKSLLFDRLKAVNLVTPCKPAPALPSPTTRSEYDDIDKPLQTACISAITAMGSGKPQSDPITDWVPINSRDWCAARLEPRRQHALAKWLSKWKDEDTAVRRNRAAPILLVSGPIGCGKTALVYAAAAELNVQVLEVSPADFSWQSNGKRPMSEAVKEALQSRQVKNEGALSQIVLIDDVDVLVKEDRSVLSAIISMTDDSKRPLVLTCKDATCIINSNIELNQVFSIEPVDSLAASFIVHAYSVVVGGEGKAPLCRKEADLIAKYTGSDLRKIAMSVELSRSNESGGTSILPERVFSLDFAVDTLTSRNKLVRTLTSSSDLPIKLRNPENHQSIDILDIAHQTLESEADSVSLDQWMRMMGDLSLAACAGVPPNIAAGMCMESAVVRLRRSDWVTKREVQTCLALGSFRKYEGADYLIETFMSPRTAFYVNHNAKRQGPILSYFGSLAQLSNSSEFSSRRVRCLLDQFAGTANEIAELRRVFPKQN